MHKHIFSILQKKIKDFASHDVEAQRNAIKEVLQYYVLNFIYHHPKYSNWVMYGGSALRTCHNLDRMSVDLDFEIDTMVTDIFLAQCKDALAAHFEATYDMRAGELAIKIDRGRGLVLKFLTVGDELGVKHSSKQVHVKIDLDHFTAPKAATERIPVNRYQLSFVIIIYNRSTLMASKLAAIFLRVRRGVGQELYEEKGRDIYDLLWYMEEKITPNLEYLKLKGVDVSDLRALFDRLTIKMSKVNIKNLRDDLTPLFENKIFIEHWLKNWHESYLRLLDAYGISTVTELEEIVISQDFITDGFSFVYWFKTEPTNIVRFEYNIEYFWIKFRDGDLPVRINNKIVSLIRWDMKKVVQRDKLLQYATLFYEKTEAYLKRTNRVVIGESIITKIIRMGALTQSALLSCDLEDLLK